MKVPGVRVRLNAPYAGGFVKSVPFFVLRIRNGATGEVSGTTRDGYLIRFDGAEGVAVCVPEHWVSEISANEVA